ncbi:MAG: hypothetical protein Q4C13_04520, partial [Clostridia bacterium]|nr:hypothetical protein [Clostridia bacterium]
MRDVMRKALFLLKFLGKLLALLLACWLLGTALLCAVYLLPVERMRANAREDAEVILADAAYPAQYELAALGPATDSYMLGIAVYEGTEGLLREALATRWADYEGVPVAEDLLLSLNDAEGAEPVAYTHYWHGYLLLLKPLLLLFNYWDIRMINLMAQIALMVLLSVLLVKKGRAWLLLPYVVSLIAVCPPTNAYCLAFSVMFYIYHAAMLYILLRGDRIA